MLNLSEKRRKEILSFGGDPDFVGFVLAWHGVIGSEPVRFTDDKPSQTIIRHTKRRLQKVWGAVHHQEWKEILNEWRKRPKLILQKSLFRLEPQPEHPPHRPRDESKWIAVCDLRNYFTRATGHPKMRLIQEIMGLGRAHGTFNPEWQRRKAWFDETVAADRLEGLHTFYSFNHDRILETLTTGIPLYEQWSEKSPTQTM
jgi:hypothetical protein